MRAKILKDAYESVFIRENISIKTGKYTTRIPLERLIEQELQMPKKKLTNLLVTIGKGRTPVVRIRISDLVFDVQTNGLAYTLNPWYEIFPSEFFVEEIITRGVFRNPRRSVGKAQNYARMIQELYKHKNLEPLLSILRENPHAEIYYSTLKRVLSEDKQVPTFKSTPTQVKTIWLANDMYDYMGIEHRVAFEHALKFLFTPGHRINEVALMMQIHDLLSTPLDKVPEKWTKKRIS